MFEGPEPTAQGPRREAAGPTKKRATDARLSISSPHLQAAGQGAMPGPSPPAAARRLIFLLQQVRLLNGLQHTLLGRVLDIPPMRNSSKMK